MSEQPVVTRDYGTVDHRSERTGWHLPWVRYVYWPSVDGRLLFGVCWHLGRTTHLVELTLTGALP